MRTRYLTDWFLHEGETCSGFEADVVVRHWVVFHVSSFGQGGALVDCIGCFRVFRLVDLTLI